jgi:hypothetical protein
MGRRQIAAPLARAPTPFQGKSDQQKDSNGADDIRHPGERTGHVACVRPDEADRRPSDNENDHRGQPVDKSPCGDSVDRSLVRPNLEVGLPETA